MAKKLMTFKTKGMNQDLSVSAFNPEFAFENMNLRLSTVEGNTMMSWVNEKGTAFITLKEWEDATKNTSISGAPLGTAILNHQVVLFTTEKTTDEIPEGQTIPNDHIYLLKWLEGDSPTMVCKELYSGNLKFSISHPIETLVSYENELIQKVYWTDGLNQPRVINIVGDIKPSLDTQFDFIPELQLQEKVSIKKQIGRGSFPAGVIQYCFTYFNKYMQESNIFYTSPLFYVSHANRAGSPEDTSIANSFKIRITDVDTNFDYVRIYSVQRTSLNGTPMAKRVADVSLKEPNYERETVNTIENNSNSLDAEFEVIGNTIIYSASEQLEEVDDEYPGVWVSQIGELQSHTFENGIGTLTFKENITSIGDYAFNKCDITSITLPETITDIESNAFNECKSLESINISASVEYVNGESFYGCVGLTSITVDINNPYFDSRDNCNAIIETDTNTLIVGCKNTVIPETVTGLGDRAFAGNTSITSINSEGDSIQISDNILHVGRNPFINTAWYNNLPNDSLVSVGKIILEWKGEKSKVTEINIAESPFTIIADFAFSYLNNLTSISLPSTIKIIGRLAFYYCTKLTEITIPDDTIYIGEYAFYGCTKLESITIPDSVKSVGSYAFSGTKLLKQAPDNSIVYIDNWAIARKGSLPSNVTVNDGIIGLADSLFANLSIVSVVLPNTLQFIGDRAFISCSNLKEITIPNSVTSIGNSAFNNCTSLTSVTIPDSVISIGDNAFANCLMLDKVIIDASEPPVLGRYAFNANKSTRLIYVSEDLVDTYRNAEGWNVYASRIIAFGKTFYIEYTDTGVNGDSIDPTELLYKGGYGIIAGTIEQKDSTLFMGNLIQSSLSKYNAIKEYLEKEKKKENPVKIEIGYDNMTKTLKLEDSASGSDYFNELNIETEYTDLTSNSTVSTGHIGASCASFRNQNYYRLGVQFQDKLGVWTSPIYLKDEQIDISQNGVKYWENEDNTLKNSTFYGKIPEDITKHLYDMGYRKARAVAVMPNYEDRVVLYQGVVNPTMYTSGERDNNTLYSQASWFFRPLYGVKKVGGLNTGGSDPKLNNDLFSFYTYKDTSILENDIIANSLPSNTLHSTLYSPAFDSFYYSTDINPDEGGNTTLISPFNSGNYLLNDMEVQGDFAEEDRFKIDWQTVTLNSPDLEFYDVEGSHSELLGIKFRQMGASIFDYTNSMIDIQTETPTVNSNSAGAKFNNKLFKGVGGCGIGSGLWYEDYIIDEERDTSNFKYTQSNIRAWIVYPWQRDGSLNNDITRPSDGGVQTAKLKKKVIANLRYANSLFSPSSDTRNFLSDPVLFMSDQNIIEKINSDKIYRGNIDTLQTSRFDTGNYGTTPDDFDDRDWILIDTGYSNAFKALVACTNEIETYTDWSYTDTYLRTTRKPRPLQKGHAIIYWDYWVADTYEELKKKLQAWRTAYNTYKTSTTPSNPNVFSTEESVFLDKCYDDFNNFKVEDDRWYFGNNFDTDTTIVDIDRLLQTVLKYAKEKHIYWLKADDGGIYHSLGPKPDATGEGDKGPEGFDWKEIRSDVGDTYTALRERKSLVRIKYKSTPHLVLDVAGIVQSNQQNSQSVYWNLSNIGDKKYVLPIINIERDIDDESFKNTIFGGQSEDALKANIWVPCGEPVNLPSTATDTYFYYLYGDTYYQRYDCLKTYPFTPEDVNQIVEIGSFMLESYVNIDGRYDRNRGQANNLNMTPQNFNLLNPVYSQRDNFFTYRIQEDDYYKNKEYPNQITWSKTKASGDETDMWTNVTMANTLEMDGDKGEVTKLIRLNDQLLCFQDTGISQILYNDNVQIASTTGVPIEIANSQKVQGKRYLSNTIGCSNKWSMVSTPAGIYFMDNVNKSIMMFNGQLNNLSQTGGFNTWCKKNILNTKGMWTPTNFNGDFVSYYDTINQDILFIGEDRALAFSEKFGTFTSFYDYGNTPYFCNLDGKGIWFKSNNNTTGLWQYQAGEYCRFFNNDEPYGMTLVGNPEPQTDKIFTNLEFRATIDTDGVDNNNKFTPLLPFDYFEVWNEYQHGLASLKHLTGHGAFVHNTKDNNSSLKRKFRMWRCDIPRDNFPAPENDDTLHIYRKNKHVMDRMRNPWLYLRLFKHEDVNRRTEVHDFVMTYFN